MKASTWAKLFSLDCVRFYDCLKIMADKKEEIWKEFWEYGMNVNICMRVLTTHNYFKTLIPCHYHATSLDSLYNNLQVWLFYFQVQNWVQRPTMWVDKSRFPVGIAYWGSFSVEQTLSEEGRLAWNG